MSERTDSDLGKQNKNTLTNEIHGKPFTFFCEVKWVETLPLDGASLHVRQKR